MIKVVDSGFGGYRRRIWRFSDMLGWEPDGVIWFVFFFKWEPDAPPFGSQFQKTKERVFM